MNDEQVERGWTHEAEVLWAIALTMPFDSGSAKVLRRVAEYLAAMQPNAQAIRNAALREAIADVYFCHGIGRRSADEITGQIATRIKESTDD